MPRQQFFDEHNQGGLQNETTTLHYEKWLQFSRVKAWAAWCCEVRHSRNYSEQATEVRSANGTREACQDNGGSLEEVFPSQHQRLQNTQMNHQLAVVVASFHFLSWLKTNQKWFKVALQTKANSSLIFFSFSRASYEMMRLLSLRYTIGAEIRYWAHKRCVEVILSLAFVNI